MYMVLDNSGAETSTQSITKCSKFTSSSISYVKMLLIGFHLFDGKLIIFGFWPFFGQDKQSEDVDYGSET